MSTNPGGSSGSVQKLIFVPLERYIARAEQSGTAVRLELKEDSSETAATLAKSFRLRLLKTSRALDDQTIVVTFEGVEAASRVATLNFGGFALGPFRVKSETDSSALLERKESHPFRRISVTEMPAQEEWRRFLGGQLDIIPRAPASLRKHLAALGSVTLIDYPPSHDLGLYFNLNSQPFRSVANRQFVARNVNRSALQWIVSGVRAPASAAIATMALPAQDSSVHFSSPLTLVYLQTDNDTRAAADVLRYQLAEAGVELNLMPLSIEELVVRSHDGDFDLTLVPVPLGERRYRRFLSSSHPIASNISGYSSADYDAAFAVGDFAAMDEILKQDVPILLLYRQAYFSAMRAGLCASGDMDPIEWQWLASVHPCAAGERP